MSRTCDPCHGSHEIYNISDDILHGSHDPCHGSHDICHGSHVPCHGSNDPKQKCSFGELCMKLSEIAQLLKGIRLGK